MHTANVPRLRTRKSLPLGSSVLTDDPSDRLGLLAGLLPDLHRPPTRSARGLGSSAPETLVANGARTRALELLQRVYREEIPDRDYH